MKVAYKNSPIEVEGIRKGAQTLFKYSLTCGECGATESARYTQMMPLEVTQKKICRPGWVVKSNKVICAECKAKRSEKVGEKPFKFDAHKVLEEIKTQSPTVENKRDIRVALELYFDTDAGKFTDNKSDRVLGEELNVPWAWVRDIREEWFGPLKVAEEVQKILNDLNAIEGRVAAAERQFSTTADNAHKEISALKKRLNELVS